jgi:hypothetical protein
MKKGIILVLVGVNVALLLALVLGPGSSAAQAQAGRGQTDYVAITARVGTENEALFVIEMSKRRMAGWRFDRGTQKLIPFQGRELERDFPLPK